VSGRVEQVAAGCALSRNSHQTQQVCSRICSTAFSGLSISEIIYMLRRNWSRMCNVECMRLWFPAMPVLVTVCCMGYITNNNVIGARICSYFTTYYEP
jgi:hypothetical protein